MSIGEFQKEPSSVEIQSLTVSGDGTVVIADAALLFQASFERSGPDLLLVNKDAPTLRVEDYFLAENPANLSSPEGAILTGDAVVRLAGPLAPGQYAQSGALQGEYPIGQVETLSSAASVQRSDGSIEPLAIGAKIFVNDVVQTGPDGTLGVTFLDGTIFTLAAGSRMIIDELIYDPEGGGNSGAFNLVQGSFVFIAGQIAKTGDMEITTPSATMGIRGTTVLVDVQVENGVVTTEVALTLDPDGSRGEITLNDLDGNLIASITSTNSKWIISPVDGETREVARTAADDATDDLLIADAFAAFNSAVGRVEQGENFVQLNRQGSSTGNSGNGNGVGRDGNLEVDSIDDPDNIVPLEYPSDVVPEGDLDEFDEGRLNAPEELFAPNITVAGREDPEISNPVSGMIDANQTAQAPLAFALISNPTNGQATIGPDGNFEYFPDANFNGTDGFAYSATDIDGNVATGNVTVEIAPVNDAPVTMDATGSGAEDTTILGVVGATDIDGDTLSYSLSTGAANGTVVVVETGSFAYTPSADFNGSDSFVIKVTDPEGASDFATVQISVSGTNDAPVITTLAGGNTGAVTEGSATTMAFGTLMASDVDEGATLTWTGSGEGTYGRLEIAADGTWAYTLDGATATLLSGSQIVTDTFTATVTDDQGATATQLVNVLITGTNNVPIVASNTIIEVDANETFAGVLTATDIDSAGDLGFALGALAAQNGTATINSDGSYTYTPNAGYLGLDSFEYSVTDAEGGVSTATVTVEVETKNSTGDGPAISLNINTEPTSDVAAGSVSIDAAGVDAVSINLSIAMDRSGSIGSSGWTEQINAVADALEILAAQFENSATGVNVQLVSYAASAQVSGPFDLQDPNLISTVRALPYTGGLTNWKAALNSSEDFFDSQSVTDSNFLFFITDGNPTTGDWQTALSDLTDVNANGYTVNIEAFGIGSNYSEVLLSQIDPTPTLLDSPSELVDAFTQTPVFNPKLISFELTLESDGTDYGVIADENSPDLIQQGLGYDIAFAEIDGIENLLGLENRFSARAQFDLDGDFSTAEVELFSTDVFAKAATVQVLSGSGQSDLLLGSDAADTLSGAAGNDLILGYGGDDVLNGGAGSNILLAGAGDDRLVISDIPNDGIGIADGGEGRDILVFDLGGDLSANVIPMLDIAGIEALDMDNAQANTLSLGLSDILNLSDSADTELETLLSEALPDSVMIYGDAGDALELTNGPSGGFVTSTDTPTVNDGANTFNVYQYVDGGNVLATLAVDADVAVSIQAGAVA